MKQLSLIILTYNSEKYIYDCLQSVYQYNDIADALEIIVVDNNSSHFSEMKTKIRMLYPDVNILQNKNNSGYGQGNNIAIHFTKAPIVAIMNPDIKLIMPVFKAILHAFANPQVIMCGGKQYDNNMRELSSFELDHHRSAFLQCVGISYYRRFDCYNQATMWLSGAFFAIRKDDFQKIGMFDENIFMYGEELDIHLRIQQMFPRKKILYLNDLKYIHQIDNRTLTKQMIKKTYESICYVCKKHNVSIKHMLWKQRIVVKFRFFKSTLCKYINRPYNVSYHEHHDMFMEVFKELRLLHRQ